MVKLARMGSANLCEVSVCSRQAERTPWNIVKHPNQRGGPKPKHAGNKFQCLSLLGRSLFVRARDWVGVCQTASAPVDKIQVPHTMCVTVWLAITNVALHAYAYGTPGIVSDVFNISEVFQCHKSACQGLMLS